MVQILLFISLLSINYPIQHNHDEHEIYVCPPCGLTCDLLVFEAPGKCHVCNMQLIEKSEAKDFNAGALQALKDKGVFYLIIFLGIFQGLILSMFLLFSRRTRTKKSNRFLALLVLSITLGCIYYLLLEYRILYDHPWISFMPFKLFYVYGTALFLYVLVSTGVRIKPFTIALHFAPAIVTALLSLILMSLGVSSNSIGYGYFNLYIIEIAGSVHAYVYFILSVRVVNSYNQQINHHVSDDRLKLYWLKQLINLLMVFFSIWIVFLIYSIIQPGHLLNNYMFIFWIFAGIIIYWIGYRGLAQPELFVIPDEKIYDTTISENQRLNPYVEALKNAMLVEKLFLNPTLTRQNVADNLKITPNQLSHVLNSLLKQSFYDFVNEYRVAEVKQKMADPKCIHLTLEGLAYEAGFNSKSTFNAIFKKSTGMTPKQFRNNLVSSAM